MADPGRGRSLYQLLRDVALASSKGVAAVDLDAYIREETRGSYGTVQALTEALGRERRAQNAADRWDLNGPAAQAAQYLGGTAFRAAQGVTLGNADELAGLVGAFASGRPVSPEAYRQAKEQANQLGTTAAQVDPVLPAVAQLAGGIGTGVATGGLMPAAVSEGSRMAVYGKGILANAGLGGLFGAVQGMGDAPDMASVPGAMASGGAMGAGLGAGVGALLPPIVGGARGLTQYAKRLMRNPTALRQEADLLVGDALNASGESPGQILRPLDQAVELGLPTPVPADINAATAAASRAQLTKVPALRGEAAGLRASREARRAPLAAAGLEQDLGVTQAEARAAAAQARQATRAGARSLYAELDNMDFSDGGMRRLLEDLMANGDPIVQKEVAAAANIRPNEPLTFSTVQKVHRRLLTAANRYAKTGEGDLADALNRASDEIDLALQIEAGQPWMESRAGYRALKTVEEAYLRGKKSIGTGDPEAELEWLREARAYAGPEAERAYHMGQAKARLMALRASSPQKSRAAVEGLQAQANPVREQAGDYDPSRMLWRRGFSGNDAVSRQDDRVRLMQQQMATEQSLTSGSPTAERLTDLGTEGMQQIAKAGGSGPQSVRAAAWRQALDAIMRPGDVAVAAMAGRDLLAPYTPASRVALLRQMYLDANLRAQARAQTRGIIAAILGGGAGATAGQ